jgi:hypothetical protein
MDKDLYVAITMVPNPANEVSGIGEEVRCELEEGDHSRHSWYVQGGTLNGVDHEWWITWEEGADPELAMLSYCYAERDTGPFPEKETCLLAGGHEGRHRRDHEYWGQGETLDSDVDDSDRCGITTEISTIDLEILHKRVRSPLHDISYFGDVRCQLSIGAHARHVALVQSDALEPEMNWWIAWETGSHDLVRLPICPASRNTGAPSRASHCLSYYTHPGPHWDGKQYWSEA